MEEVKEKLEILLNDLKINQLKELEVIGNIYENPELLEVQ